MLGQTPRKIKRAGPSDVVLVVECDLGLERGVVLRFRISLFEFEYQRHQGFGDKAAAIDPKMAVLVRAQAQTIRLPVHETFSRASFLAAARALAMNARIISGSFSPGAPSTPDDTSTASGRTMRIASATFSGVSPPESMIGFLRETVESKFQSNARPWPPGRVA